MKSSLKALVLASVLLITGHSAQAQNASWTGGAGDNSYANPNNWNGGVPTGTATVGITSTIDLPGAATALSGDFTVTSGTVVVNANTAGFTAQTIQVHGGGVLTLNLPTNATFTVLDDVVPPTQNGSTFIGTNNGNGQLNVEGTGTLHVTGSEGVGVGFGGTGTFNQTGANVVVAGLIGIGGDGNVPTPNPLGDAGGTGVYTISSGTFNAQDLDIGVGSTTGGTSPTSGVLNINGGEVDSTALSLGVGANGATVIKNTTGNIIQSAGLLDTHLGTLDIGETAGGVGYYNLTGSGTFTGGTVNVGDQTGSSGTYTQTGGTASATTFTIGQSGAGLASLSAGQLAINTGGSLNLGSGAGSTGTMTQSGGTLTLNGTAALDVGGAGNGTYNQQAGLVTDSNTGDIQIGTGSGNGTYNLSGGTLTSNGTFNVGGSTGTATFNYSGGTLTFAGGMNINSNGTFNQNTNFDVSGLAGTPLTLNSGAVYNLNSGTLTIAGSMGTFGSSGIFAASSTATFNFAGGTVLSSSVSTGWQDNLNGTVTNNSILNTTQNDIDLTGTLTGNGMLTIEGGNTVTIDTLGGNSSAGTWSIDVVSGTASINANTFPSSGNMTIENSGTLELAENGVNTLSGSVTGNGAGNFNVNFGGGADLLELTGPVNVTGSTTLTGGGTLEVLDGSFGNIGSAGSLLVGNGTSTGTVNISGIASYNGNTTVDPGATLLANDITSTGVVTVNGILGSNATIGSTIGASTLHISGSYAASTGTLLIRMVALGGGAVNTDDFTIANGANVTGSAFSIVNPQITTGTFTILTSGALTGGGAIVQPSSNLFLNQTIVQNGNDLQLVTTTNTSASIPGLNLTPNEAAVAATLDALINNNSGLSASQFQNFSSLLNSIGASGTNASQLAKNYEQLTPESLQYAQSIAYEHSAFLVSKVDGFDNALHHEFSGFDTSGVTIVLPGFNSDMGRQMQSMLAYDPSSFHQSAPNGVNYYPESGDTPTTGVINDSPSSPAPSSQVMSDSATTAPMPVRATHSMTIRKPYSNFSAFIGGDGTIADLNQNQGASYAPSSKASYTAEDVIGGISYRMTSNLAAGILFDYSHTDATTDNYGSKTKVDSYSPGVFATYGEKGFYINGLFSYGRNNYSNTRDVPVVNGVASSNPDGNQYTAALDAGQELHIGDDWTITPQGGLTYTHLDIDSFTETGAEPADLSVQAQHDDSLRSRLGASVGYTTFAGHLTLLPTFTALWQHEFLDENAPLTSTFNDFSSGAFTIHSVSMGRDSALIGVGLTAELSNTMAIFFQANADLNGNYSAENIVGGFKGSF